MMRRYSWLAGAMVLAFILITGCSNSTADEGTTEPGVNIPSGQEDSSGNGGGSTTEGTTEVPPASESDEKAMLTTADLYKKAEFTVDKYDEEHTMTREALEAKGEILKPFLTSKYFVAKMADRNIALPLQVANKESVTLHPEDMNFSVKENRGDSLLITYTLNLILTDKNGKETRNIPLEGDITFLQENNQWLIQDDTYNIKELQNLVYE
ncbi:hypothetical protein [Paenibacillus sp. FSL K6-0108]|uniref:hypothetical protein n=1 Tax=Paenibacillus sp. FSL K6-0108 TaxID=2921417 RepID=UPI00324D2FAA